MSSRKQRERLREKRMEFDRRVDEGRIARETAKPAVEDIDLTPKKKTAKSKNRASQKEKK